MSAATSYDISRWFDQGVKQGATHLIVVCDTYDHDDYPVFVTQEQNVKKIEKEHNKNMQQVMEVYKLSDNKEEQMQEHRCFRY